MVLIGATYPGTCIVSNQGRDFTNTDVFTSKMLMIGQIFQFHFVTFYCICKGMFQGFDITSMKAVDQTNTTCLVCRISIGYQGDSQTCIGDVDNKK